MKRKTKLSTSMTSTQFDNGYWYATEIKNFETGKIIGSRPKQSGKKVKEEQPD